MRKYRTDNLVPMFLKAAALRNDMLASGFSDNGGAIHSAERILDILGLWVKYPELTHRNGLKLIEAAECSEEAFRARRKGETVLIEHVSPLRDLTRKAIHAVEGLDQKAAQRKLVGFLEKHYRLVLLTPEETIRLNKENRSKMDPERLKGIKMRGAPQRRASKRPGNQTGNQNNQN